jgi:hypothetical protein
VFQLRLGSPFVGGDPDGEATEVVGQGRNAKVKAKERGVVPPQHVYDLRRRTSASGESIVFSCLPCDMILIGLVFFFYQPMSMAWRLIVRAETTDVVEQVPCICVLSADWIGPSAHIFVSSAEPDL